MAAGVNLEGGGHQPVSLPSHVPRWAKVTNIMRLIVPPELIIRLLRKIRRGPCRVVATSGNGGGAGGRTGMDGTWARGGASHCRQAPTRTLVCRTCGRLYS